MVLYLCARLAFACIYLKWIRLSKVTYSIGIVKEPGEVKMHKPGTIASIVENVNANGVHETFGSVESASRNGWYDYFCDETMLKHRTKKFLPILNGISGKGKVRDYSRVTFKNTFGQRLYDLMTLKTRDTLLCIENFPERNGAQWLVTTYHGKDMREEEDEHKFNDTAALTAWLNTPWEQAGDKGKSGDVESVSDLSPGAGDEDDGDYSKEPDSKSVSLEEIIEVIEEILHGDPWMSDRQREALENAMRFIDSKTGN